MSRLAFVAAAFCCQIAFVSASVMPSPHPPGLDASALVSEPEIGPPKKVTIRVINGLTKQLKMLDSFSVSLEAWNFTSVSPAPELGKFAVSDFPATFTSNYFHPDEGYVSYQIEGTEMMFQIKGEKCKLPTSNFFSFYPCITVNWGNVDESKVAVFPRKSVIFEADTYVDIVISPRAQDFVVPTGDPTAQWMFYYRDIVGPLSLAEMTLPCTHHSGTYYPMHLFSEFFQERQAKSIKSQLDSGTRVLDLRVGYSVTDPDDTWIITNGERKMNYPLKRALKEVKDFIDMTTLELVILDFQRLNELDGVPTPKDKLKELVQTELKGYHLDYNPEKGVNATTPLKDLWKLAATSKQRVLLFWNEESFGAGYDWFWPRIVQKTFESVKTPDEMFENLAVWWGEYPNLKPPVTNALASKPKQELAEVLTALRGAVKGSPLTAVTTVSTVPPSSLKDAPDAPIGTIYNTGIFLDLQTWGPRHAATEISQFLGEYMYGSSAWTLTASIVSVDFMDTKTNIVGSAVTANLLKGTRLLYGQDLSFTFGEN